VCALKGVSLVEEGSTRIGVDGSGSWREALAILLTGGTKKRLQRDIETAKASWADCKRRRPRKG